MTRIAIGVLAAVLSSVGVAQATEYGPPLGNVRYVTTIQDNRGVPDLDDYVGSLLVGERLTVKITARKKSDLRPGVVLIRPDASVLQPEVRVKGQGKKLFLDDLEIDQTGRWTVRVLGRDRSTGAYQVRFKIRPAAPVVLDGQHVGGVDPPTRDHLFAAVDPSDLRLDVRWRRGDSPVSLTRLLDPGGRPVPGASGDAVEEARTRGRRTRLPRATLAGGDGDHVVTAGVATGGEATYRLTARIRPLARPRGKRPVTLTSDEPWLDARATPHLGVGGEDIRLTGDGFATDGEVTVIFGELPGTDVRVAPGGDVLDVTVPAAGAGEIVAVTVVNPDGQAVSRSAYFLYALPPEATGIETVTGDPVIGGSTDGGQTFVVTGRNLSAEHEVLFGTRQAVVVTAAGDTAITVRSPSAPLGFVTITVRDAFDRESQVPGAFEYKLPPRFAAQPYSPSFGDPLTALTVNVTGSGFLPTDVLVFDGVETPYVAQGAAAFAFDVPALPRGDHTVALRDRVGTVVQAPPFVVKGAPTIAGVSLVGGSYSGDDGVPLAGGAVVEVAGSDFHALDTVVVGGVTVDVSDRDFDSLRFVSPAGAAGLLDIEITDEIARGASLQDALRRFGLADVSNTSAPPGTVVDDMTAWRGALGDLDGDGDDDDLVAVSYGYYRDNVYRGFRTPSALGVRNAPGSRSEYTRILMGGATGDLVDGTAAFLPAAGSDPTGADDWNAHCAALGDVDGTGGADVFIGGIAPDYQVGNDVRWFTNDGTGALTLETADGLPVGYRQPVYATDQNGTQHLVFSPVYPHGLPAAMQLGDLDGDGDLDLVVGRDFYDATYSYVDPNYVDFTQTPPYVSAANAAAYLAYNVYYYSATKVFLNDLSTGDGWSDATDTSMPAVGDSVLPIVPGMHARDIALGDVDRDGDLDVVLVWDNPLTVSPFGLYGGADQERVATRVLRNNGSGVFTDVTSAWLPAGVSPEMWHADRVALADLDADLDLDLVLLLRQTLDAYLGAAATTRHSLRILRNDGVGTGFVDVTTAALPTRVNLVEDPLSGEALAVADVDGDGHLDLLVATTRALFDGQGTRLRSTRLLLGDGAFGFRRADDFLPPAATDSGEAHDLLLGDVDGDGGLRLLRLSETVPSVRPSSGALRAADRTE